MTSTLPGIRATAPSSTGLAVPNTIDSADWGRQGHQVQVVRFAGEKK